VLGFKCHTTRYKVEELVDRFIREGWATLTHHCRTLEKLQIKTELLVLGTLAMLGGTMNSFCQLPMVTNICATDHNQFFLKFVRCMYNVRHEYISLPKTEEELSGSRGTMTMTGGGQNKASGVE
jgi:hypothetical protein